MNCTKSVLAIGLLGGLLAACSSHSGNPAVDDTSVAGTHNSGGAPTTRTTTGLGGTNPASSASAGGFGTGGTAASSSIPQAGGSTSTDPNNTTSAAVTSGGAATGGISTNGGAATGGVSSDATAIGGSASGGSESGVSGGTVMGGAGNPTTGGDTSTLAMTSGGTATGGVSSDATALGGTASGGSENVAAGGTGTGGDTSQVTTNCTADLQNDPKNCGACGNVCNLFAAFPKCVAAQCEIDHCAIGYVDLNQLGSDGCERICTPSNGGVEICDHLDNDCNGVADDGFDMTTDVQNCGACGNVCDLPRATAGCSVSGATALCHVSTCTDGYADINKLTQDGCEYKCPVWPPQPEACDGIDNNCNGEVNEENPGSGAACDSNCPNGTCLGECTSGVTRCVGSKLICTPGKGPSAEICNGKDDDCDGTVDNGFDLQKDVRHCGTCGTVCNLPNAIASCASGVCVIAACQPGFASIDGDMSNGCEFGCAVNPPTVETCNGIDDDCDGIIDNPATVATQKPPRAGCYPKAGTPCEGADFVCTGVTGWRCSYGSGVEVDDNGKLATAEALCDGIDGNCNGQVDETFADLNNSCDNGVLGACRDVGKRLCNPNDPKTTFCDLSVLPDPVPGAPAVEICNGVDDDCNGQIDDGVVDDMVRVIGTTTFYIDRYEASRPDATSLSVGLNQARRCVNAGVLPWTSASYAEAANACNAVGARLCTAAELQVACEGGVANVYPYGTSYAPTACNGIDYDGVPGGVIDHLLVPTGSNSTCLSEPGIYDLSGNAAEWTSTVTGTTGGASSLAIYMAKGGSYLSPAAGLTCQFTMSVYASNAILPELGFRCCKDGQ